MHDSQPGKKDAVPCACGKGALAVEILTFGNWQVMTLLEPCAVCGSTDLHAQRKAQSAHAP